MRLEACAGRSVSVLVDGAHFLRKTATGIGSYARTLLASLRASGCQVDVVFGERIKGRKEETLELAAQLFGNGAAEGRLGRIVRALPFVLRVAAGMGGRARAIGVPVDSVDLAPFEPPFPPCSRVLNAYALYDRASLAFLLRKQFTELELPAACGVAHWTAPMPLKVRGVPNIYTLHDLVPLQFPYMVLDREANSVRLHRTIAREAHHIITVSEYSKEQIVKILGVPGDRVSVTYQPVPNLPALARADAGRLVETVYGVKPGAYALFLGAIEPKKNLKRLIEAFLLAGVRIPLLIAGPLGWLYDEDMALIDVVGRQTRTQDISAGVRGGRMSGIVSQTLPPVRYMGYLPRRHAVALLQCARFLAFPSICEGFGLPVLEAMQLGVPVFTSNVSSLPEVAGDAAVFADPLNVLDMAQQIRHLANDDGLCEDLARRGPPQAARFGPEGYRERLASAYRKAGVEIGMRSASPGPGIARLVPAGGERGAAAVSLGMARSLPG